ncbi:MAG: Gfo/Idh/MocA family oxidoreductase [Capsulimonadales bacterium]|nr:Gfo/Idh/MocA family oxidoreductase [Capsulimonadales bacterium]
MTKIGLIGCGAVADFGHLPAIAETPGLELVAVVDPNPEAARRAAERFPHTVACTDSETFFAVGRDRGMQAVTIASPAPAHLTNVRDAAAYGLHILCEKPLGTDEAQIREMIDLTDRAGVRLATALCYRYSPVAQRIRELVEHRAIGDIRVLRLIYLWNLHGKYFFDKEGGRFESPLRIGRMREGGPMTDCGVHQIDLACWWLQSDVERQQAVAAWVDNDYEAPDHVWLHLDHRCGAHSHIEMAFSYTHTAAEPVSLFTYELIGTEGLIKYDRDGWRFSVRHGFGTDHLPGASEKNFHGMYAAWRDALTTGDFRHLPSAEDGLRITRIAEEAVRSAITDRAQRRNLS